ncbi:MAG: succinate dehydrogenase, hydrophobic membrane anchor protein [Hyphomicrobiaceae bacterium]
MNMRTPLKNARRLGSAHEGADHFWQIRVSSIAVLVLSLVFAWVVATTAGADYATVKATLGHPFVALCLGLLSIAMAVHMKLGMQVIIEDYVHGEFGKIAFLVLNTFFSYLVGAACVLALVKLSLGA